MAATACLSIMKGSSWFGNGTIVYRHGLVMAVSQSVWCCSSTHCYQTAQQHPQPFGSFWVIPRALECTHPHCSKPLLWQWSLAMGAIHVFHGVDTRHHPLLYYVDSQLSPALLKKLHCHLAHLWHTASIQLTRRIWGFIHRLAQNWQLSHGSISLPSHLQHLSPQAPSI